MKKIALVAALLSAAPALAQQQAVSVERIGARIGALVIENTALAEQIEKLQAQLATVQAKLRELEAAKTEQKPN